jgi:hypothetical protein
MVTKLRLPILSAGDLKRKRGERAISGYVDSNYDEEESNLLAHVEKYKSANNLPYVGPSEVLWILKKLGYDLRRSSDECNQLSESHKGSKQLCLFSL